MGACTSSCSRCMETDHTSVIAKIACLFVTVSATLYIISFSSTTWVSGLDRRETLDNRTDLTIGLWKTCYTPVGEDRVCVRTKDFLLQDWNDEWLPGVQAILSCGLALELFTAVDMWAFIIVPRLQIGVSALFMAGCSSFAASALCFLGVLIFGIQQASDNANFHDTVLNWAYGTMVLALGCILLSYLLIMCDFYHVLYHQADKKSKRKLARERVINALDEAVITNHNSELPAESKHTTVKTDSTLHDSDDNSVGSQAALFTSERVPMDNLDESQVHHEKSMQSQSSRMYNKRDAMPSTSRSYDNFRANMSISRSDEKGREVASTAIPKSINPRPAPVKLFQAKQSDTKPT